MPKRKETMMEQKALHHCGMERSKEVEMLKKKLENYQMVSRKTALMIHGNNHEKFFFFFLVIIKNHLNEIHLDSLLVQSSFDFFTQLYREFLQSCWFCVEAQLKTESSRAGASHQGLFFNYVFLAWLGYECYMIFHSLSKFDMIKISDDGSSPVLFPSSYEFSFHSSTRIFLLLLNWIFGFLTIIFYFFCFSRSDGDFKEEKK